MSFVSWWCWRVGADLRSLDAFRAWVARETAIAVQDQITLTGQGKAVRFGTLAAEVGFLIPYLGAWDERAGY